MVENDGDVIVAGDAASTKSTNMFFPSWLIGSGGGPGTSSRHPDNHEEEEEDPKFVDQCILKMEKEIQKLDRKKKLSPYKKALSVAPKRVASRSFRLMFLRAARFDSREAAQKIIKHFECKADLFGHDKVAKDITLEDLDEDDIDALKAGSIQFLPDMDREGRVVQVVSLKHAIFKTWENQLKMQWWLTMGALQNETLQKKGVVSILYNVGLSQEIPEQISKLASKWYFVGDGLPLRRVAIFNCNDNAKTRLPASVLRVVVGDDRGIPKRDHFGTHQECQYELVAYGIPHTFFPVDFQGMIKKESFLNFVDTQREKEKSQRMIMDQTCQKDVLVGLQQSCPANNMGNLHLTGLIRKWQSAYDTSSTLEQICISWEIVKTIQTDLGGRFLELDDGSDTWKVVPDTKARELVERGLSYPS